MHIGIIGGGQLARMLAQAGAGLGFRFSFLVEEKEDCAPIQGLGRIVTFDPDSRPDTARLYRDLGQPDVVTVEKEAVDPALLGQFKRLCPVHPQPDIIEICQHRGREKQFLHSLDLPLVPFQLVSSRAQFDAALSRLGLPVIVKLCEQGYDGQNQWKLESPQAVTQFLQQWDGAQQAVVEKCLKFERELSILTVRNRKGQVTNYPVTENFHRDGILLYSLAPADYMTPGLRRQIDIIVERLLGAWDYCGVLAIECFQAGNKILINELAPRVHNSGHWTLSGASVSQFESHLRAITWMWLKDPACQHHSAMVNLLGTELPSELEGIPELQVQHYNKQVRPRRKLGHVNLTDPSRKGLLLRLVSILRHVYGNEHSSPLPSARRTGWPKRVLKRLRNGPGLALTRQQRA